MIIDRYLRKNFIKTFVIVSIYFLLILFIVDFFQFALPIYKSFFKSFFFAIIRSLHMIKYIIYFIFVVTFIIMFSNMNKHAEITIIISTCGYSLLKILKVLLLPILSIWLIIILILNPMTSMAMKKIESSQKISDSHQSFKKVKDDVFFRDKNENGENFIYMKYHPKDISSELNNNLFFKEIKILKLNKNNEVEEIIFGSNVVFMDNKLYIKNVKMIPILKAEQLRYLDQIVVPINIKRTTIVEKIYSNKNFVKQLEQNHSIYSLIRLLIKNDKGKNIAEDENSVKTNIYSILRMPIVIILIYLISIKDLIKPMRNKNKIFGIIKIISIIFIIYISLSIMDNVSIKKMNFALQISFLPSIILLLSLMLFYL